MGKYKELIIDSDILKQLSTEESNDRNNDQNDQDDNQDDDSFTLKSVKNTFSTPYSRSNDSSTLNDDDNSLGLFGKLKSLVNWLTGSSSNRNVNNNRNVKFNLDSPFTDTIERNHQERDSKGSFVSRSSSSFKSSIREQMGIDNSMERNKSKDQKDQDFENDDWIIKPNALESFHDRLALFHSLPEKKITHSQTEALNTEVSLPINPSILTSISNPISNLPPLPLQSFPVPKVKSLERAEKSIDNLPTWKRKHDNYENDFKKDISVQTEELKESKIEETNVSLPNQKKTLKSPIKDNLNTNKIIKENENDHGNNSTITNSSPPVKRRRNRFSANFEEEDYPAAAIHDQPEWKKKSEFSREENLEPLIRKTVSSMISLAKSQASFNPISYHHGSPYMSSDGFTFKTIREQVKREFYDILQKEKLEEAEKKKIKEKILKEQEEVEKKKLEELEKSKIPSFDFGSMEKIASVKNESSSSSSLPLPPSLGMEKREEIGIQDGNSKKFNLETNQSIPPLSSFTLTKESKQLPESATLSSSNFLFNSPLPPLPSSSSSLPSIHFKHSLHDNQSKIIQSQGETKNINDNEKNKINPLTIGTDLIKNKEKSDIPSLSSSSFIHPKNVHFDQNPSLIHEIPSNDTGEKKNFKDEQIKSSLTESTIKKDDSSSSIFSSSIPSSSNVASFTFGNKNENKKEIKSTLNDSSNLDKKEGNDAISSSIPTFSLSNFSASNPINSVSSFSSSNAPFKFDNPLISSASKNDSKDANIPSSSSSSLNSSAIVAPISFGSAKNISSESTIETKKVENSSLPIDNNAFKQSSLADKNTNSTSNFVFKPLFGQIPTSTLNSNDESDKKAMVKTIEEPSKALLVPPTFTSLMNSNEASLGNQQKPSFSLSSNPSAISSPPKGHVFGSAGNLENKPLSPFGFSFGNRGDSGVSSNNGGDDGKIKSMESKIEESNVGMSGKSFSIPSAFPSTFTNSSSSSSFIFGQSAGNSSTGNIFGSNTFDTQPFKFGLDAKKQDGGTIGQSTFNSTNASSAASLFGGEKSSEFKFGNQQPSLFSQQQTSSSIPASNSASTSSASNVTAKPLFNFSALSSQPNPFQIQSSNSSSSSFANNSNANFNSTSLAQNLGGGSGNQQQTFNAPTGNIGGNNPTSSTPSFIPNFMSNNNSNATDGHFRFTSEGNNPSSDNAPGGGGNAPPKFSMGSPNRTYMVPKRKDTKHVRMD